MSLRPVINFLVGSLKNLGVVVLVNKVIAPTIYGWLPVNVSGWISQTDLTDALLLTGAQEAEGLRLMGYSGP